MSYQPRPVHREVVREVRPVERRVRRVVQEEVPIRRSYAPVAPPPVQREYVGKIHSARSKSKHTTKQKEYIGKIHTTSTKKNTLVRYIPPVRREYVGK